VRAVAGLVFVLVAVVLAWSPCASGPVSQSQNDPHLLQWRGQNAVKLVGWDAGYQLLADSQFDLPTFFDRIAACNCNFTRFFAIDPWADDLYPWARSDRLFDLARFDPAYWDRLTYLLSEASKRGIIVEIAIFDECGYKGIEPERWPRHPLNSANNQPGTIGFGLITATKAGVPDAWNMDNAGLMAIYDDYLQKMVEVTRSFDNVVLEIGNELSAGYGFHKWVAARLRELGSSAPIGVNPWVRDVEEVQALPEANIVSLHGHREPEQLRSLVADLWPLGKAIIVDTDGWYDSVENQDNTLICAQQALDLGCHFNARGRGDWGDGPEDRAFLARFTELRRQPPAAPTPQEYAGGPKAEIDLGRINRECGLRQVRPEKEDGWSGGASKAGAECRYTAIAKGGSHPGRYLYFDVAPEFQAGLRVLVSVVVYDEQSSEAVALQYDAPGQALADRYRPAPPVAFTGTGTWRTVEFVLHDPLFAGRQNDGADFRIFATGKDTRLYLDRVCLAPCP